MIREYKEEDRNRVDEMQFALQKYFSEIDTTKESLEYSDMAAAHRYMQKMIDDSNNMNGKVYVAERDGEVVGFIQGVIIEHRRGEDEVYDLSHAPSKEGWIGLLFVEPKCRGERLGQELFEVMRKYFEDNKCSSIRLLVLSDNSNAISFYKKNGFIGHDLEMVLKA